MTRLEDSVIVMAEESVPDIGVDDDHSGIRTGTLLTHCESASQARTLRYPGGPARPFVPSKLPGNVVTVVDVTAEEMEPDWYSGMS